MARTRNYATVVYPESAPLDWMDILNDLHINAFVSPLHDRDLNKKTKEIKKPHYHVMVMFESVKTDVQAKGIFSQFGGVGCEAINSSKAYARYLCHLDDKDKEKYDVEDVRVYGSVNYDSYIEIEVPKEDVLIEIVDYISRHQGITFAFLVERARYKKGWFKCLVSSGSAYFIREYMNSLKFENNIKEKVEMTIPVSDSVVGMFGGDDNIEISKNV